MLATFSDYHLVTWDDKNKSPHTISGSGWGYETRAGLFINHFGAEWMDTGSASSANGGSRRDLFVYHGVSGNLANEPNKLYGGIFEIADQVNFNGIFAEEQCSDVYLNGRVCSRN